MQRARARRSETASFLGAHVRGSKGAGGPWEGGRRSLWPGKSPPNAQQPPHIERRVNLFTPANVTVCQKLRSFKLRFKYESNKFIIVHDNILSGSGLKPSVSGSKRRTSSRRRRRRWPRRGRGRRRNGVRQLEASDPPTTLRRFQPHVLHHGPVHVQLLWVSILSWLWGRGRHLE